MDAGQGENGYLSTLADIVSSFSERLKALRGSESIMAFAKKIGISHGALDSYEKGTTSPNEKKLIHISGRLGVDPGWLLFGGSQNSPETQKPSDVGGFEPIEDKQHTKNTELQKNKAADVGGFDPAAAPESDRAYRYMELALSAQQDLIMMQRQVAALKDEVAALRLENQRLRLTREYPTHLAEPPRPYAGPSAPVAAKAPGVKYEMDHPMPPNIALQDNDEPYKPGK